MTTPIVLSDNCGNGVFGPNFDLGTWYTVVAPASDPLAIAFDTYGWGRWPLEPVVDTFYALEFSAPLPANVHGRLWHGLCGVGSGIDISVNPGVSCFAGIWHANGARLLNVLNLSGVDVSLTFRLKPGPC